MEDADHEYDCESEEMDAKGPTFHTHHFRKKNILYPWVLLSIGFPLISAWSHYFGPYVFYFYIKIDST